MIKNRMAQRGQAGFTLIELLVVVAILAILVGVAVVGVGAMRDNANTTACKSDKDTVETAALANDIEDGTKAATGAALETSGYLKKVRDGANWAIDWTSGSPDASYTGTEYGGQTC